MTKHTWTGDLDDDCTLYVGDYVARCEKLSSELCNLKRGSSTILESWHVAVYRNDIEVFHDDNHDGLITGGPIARAICEAIINESGDWHERPA